MKNSFFFRIFCICLLLFYLQSCYFIEHFESEDSSEEQTTANTPGVQVLGQTLGNRAGSVDQAALAAVHAVTSDIPPASIRPDPDLYARQLMLQFRPEGSTIARLIGSVDAFRPLLGGASEDFQKAPQTAFDATSLLATYSVSQVVCQGLIAPNSWQHPDWSTILPAPASDWQANIAFLVQRVTGRTVSQISDALLTNLKTILDLEHDARATESTDITSGIYDLQSYVPICSLLTVDPEAQSL